MGQRADEIRRQDDRDVSPVDRDVVIRQETEITATSGGEEEPEVIRAEIEQTRAEMTETIDAIQERLDPQHLKEQAKEQVREQAQEAKAMVRDATVGRAERMLSNARSSAKGGSASMLETIKQNPVPAALVGIGLGWLVMNRRSASESSQMQYEDRDMYAAGQAPYAGRTSYAAEQTPYQGQSTTSETAGRAQERAGQITSQAQERAGQLSDQARERAGQLRSQAQERAGQLRSQTQQQARRAEDRFEQLLQENPLAVGAVAVALGAAIGLAVPETRKEHELMGETRDSLMQQAKSTAQDTMQRAQRVAEEAKDTAQQEAREQGLSG